MSDEVETDRYIQLRDASGVERVSDEFIATLVRIGADDSFVATLREPPPPRHWRDARRAWLGVSRALEHDEGWLRLIAAVLRAAFITIRALVIGSRDK